MTKKGCILCRSMLVENHLILQNTTLLPSSEWTPPASGWVVIRVLEGLGYALQSAVARELNIGDGFVMPGGHRLVIRASQLCALKLEFYLVQPELLNGLLTMAEAGRLKQATRNMLGKFVAFAADDALGQKFPRIACQPHHESLSTRMMLIQFWAQALNSLLSVPASTGLKKADHAPNSRERFRELVSKMTEAEAVSHSLGELAEKLHCSPRHFNRLFKAEMGVSFRDHRTEQRLQQALKLLAEKDAKVINVAYEVGYRHLGLFNLMFKQRFGMTPSAWRRQKIFHSASKKNLRASLAFALAAFLTGLFFSNPPLRAQATNEPPPQALHVEHYEVTGNTLLPPQKIDEIIAKVPGATGTNVTFANIRAALGELQMAYRERGYVAVSVKLPPQKLTNATVKVQVIEGKLSDIKVTGNKYFSMENVLRALPSLHSNLMLNSHVFQRELDTANANRDRQIYPVIAPGPEPGTTELTLKVKDTLPLHARVEINNQSTPGTPESRVVFNAQYDNLWQLEHQIGVNYSFTPLDFHSSTPYSMGEIDDPLIANYGIYYRIPLGRPQAVQREIDDSGGSFGYNEVTHQYALPPSSSRPELTFYANRSVSDTGVQRNNKQVIAQEYATNNAGTVFPSLSIVKDSAAQSITLNENMGAKFNMPLKLRNIQGSVSVGIDFKRYRQSGFSTNENYFQIEYPDSLGNLVTINQDIPQTQPQQSSSVEYFPLNLGFNVSRPDKWGSTSLNAQANYNLASVGSLADLAYSSAASSAVISNSTTHTLSTNFFHNQARNNYFTVQAGLVREQRLYKDWTMLVRADGQWSPAPLFSNEQFAMGGTAGVRGYENGESYGDAGWRVSVEPRTPPINIGMVDGNLPFWLRGSVFMDYGQTYYVEQIYPAFRTSYSFWGVGGTLTANIGSHLDARLTLALPMIATAVTRAWDMHIYFGLGAQF